MKLIERIDYLDELQDLQQTPDIKIITGVHGSGKSTLLDALSTRILRNDERANIIRVNYNLPDFEQLLDYRALETYVEDRYQSDQNNYLIIEEIQMCDSYEKAINSLLAKGKYDIYVTGSNASLQSNDLTAAFAGRTCDVHIYPFSFREYLTCFPSEHLYGSLTKYISDGGMAGSYAYNDETQKFHYINSDVLNGLIVRDIMKKYRFRNEPLLHELIDFLMHNIGNAASVRAITDMLPSNKYKVDHKTVGQYLEALCNAYIFYRVRRYDIRGKRCLRSEAKYYLADQSFRFARLGVKKTDYDQVLENMVAIELLRRGYEVYVGVLYKREIDFVAMKQGDKMYIQVANDVSEPRAIEREVAPLLRIKDAYPKLLIARTYQPEFQFEGVRVIDAAEWLLNPSHFV